MNRVLIVDDSLLQQKVLSAIVEDEGYEALAAASGSEALEMLEAQHIDCLILDLLMPEMGGMQVLEALQTRNLQLPIIVVSADIQEWVRTSCLELGVREFLTKPVKQEALCTALKNAILDPEEHAPCH